VILFRILFLLFLQVGLSHAGDLTLLSSGPLVADGVTQSVIQIYHPEITERSRVRIRTTGGEVISKSSSADGAITVTLLPESGAEDMVLSVRVRRGLSLDEEVVVPLQGAASSAMVVTVEPPVLSPEDRRALVTIQGGGDVAISASVGSIGSVNDNGDGSWSAEYTAPTGLADPVEVVFAAVDRLRGGVVASTAVLPVGIVRSETFQGPSGGRAVLFSGEQEFGPTLVSPAGTVAFDVPVYPGVNQFQLHTFAPGGRNSEETAQVVGVSPPPMVFAPYASPLIVPAGIPFDLSLVARDGSGEPLVDASVIEVESSGVSSLQMVAPGLYRLTLTPSVLGGEFNAEVNFINGESILVSGEGVVPSPLLSATSDPTQLHPDTSRITATVEVRDHTGQRVDVPRDELSFAVEGGTVRGRVRHSETGVFTREIDVTNSEQLLFTVLPPVAVSTRPPVRLSVWTGARGDVTTAGAVVPLFVIAEDAFGLPVANQRVQLSSNTLGSLPASLATGEKGVGIVFFRPALTDIGPIRLTATADFDTSSTFVWRMPAGVVHTPVAIGNTAERAAVDRWRGSLPLVNLRPAPVVAPVVVAVVDVIPSTTSVVTTVVDFPDITVASSDPRELPAVTPIEVVEEPTNITSDSLGLEGMGSRVRLGLIQVGRSFSQSNDGITDDVPSKATFSESLPIGAIGFRANFEVDLGGVLTELDASFAAHSVDSGSGGELNYAYSITAGAVIQRPWNSGFMWEAGGWLHRGDGLLMSYNSDQTKLIQTTNAFNGLRIGGGILGAVGPLSTRLRIAETLAPLPVATHIAGRVDMLIPDLVKLNKPIWGAVDTSLDLLHRSSEIGGVRAFVFERRISVTLMVGIDL
jgi:hypothetical protein